MAVVHVIIISLVVLWVQISSGLDTTLTYKVPAGSRECFFEDISAEGEIDLEYQVFSCPTHVYHTREPIIMRIN